MSPRLQRQLGVSINEQRPAGRRGQLRRDDRRTGFRSIFAAYDGGRASVCVTTLVADLETPVSAYLKLAAGRAGNMFLLESVEGGAQRGRYSMIGLDPDVVWRAIGAQSRDQPPRAASIPTLSRPAPASRSTPCAPCSPNPASTARRPAADGGGHFRLSRL